MNKFEFMGRLTKEPEAKSTTSGTQVTVIDLAVNRRYTKGNDTKVDFFHITSFNKTAEFITKYFKKGRQVLVEGRIQNRTWEDQTGTKRYATDYIAEQVYFADSSTNKNNENEINGEYITIDDTAELPL